ncbi:MAG: hypothetical protein EGS41_08090 [Prevotella sp.]|nr:hypothetical protein [Prevotella sp.]
MGMIKNVRRQDCGWKQAAGCSGETSINLSNDIFEYLSCGMIEPGEECGITFRIFKQDYLDSLAFIETQLPLYRSSSRESLKIDVGNPIFERLSGAIEKFFGTEQSKEYTVTMYRRKDGRIYLKNLKQNGFTIRDFLVEYSSSIEFDLCDDCFALRLKPFNV